MMSVTERLFVRRIGQFIGRILAIALDWWLFMLFYRHGGWPSAAAFAFAFISMQLYLLRPAT
jgi:hypothetical protein